MSTLELDLRGVKGFLVADVRGRVIGPIRGIHVHILGHPSGRH